MENQEGLEKAKAKLIKLSRINGKISITAFVMVVSSPFIWIWYDGWISFKLLASGVIILSVTSWVGNVLEITSKKTLKHFECDKQSDKTNKSRFQERLEEMKAKQDATL